MKKRIITILLVLALSASLFTVFAVNSAAETVMGKSIPEMVSELTEFIGIANKQVKRDDYQNMPAGMQTKHPATVKLEEQLAEAKDLRKHKNDPGAAEKIDAFLVELFGGWDAEAMNYVNGNKPYGDFQNALYLRGEYIDKEVVYGEKGWQTVTPGDYTHDSWRNLAEKMAAINVCYRVTDGYFPLQDATRSSMYKLMQDYFDAFDSLVKYEGDTEINGLKMLLYFVLETEETIDIIHCEEVTPFPWKLEDLIGISKENPNSEATLRYKTWVEGARACYADPNATAEDIAKYVDINWYRHGTKAEDYQPQVCPGPDEMSDEEFSKKWPTASRWQNYVNYRDAEIFDFRASLFVGGNYKSAVNKLYFSVKCDNDLGYYNKEDWSKFQRACDEGVVLADSYLTTDVELRDYYNETILPALKELKSKRLDQNEAHDAIYKRVMDYYNTSVKGWEHLFYAHTVDALVIAIDNYEKAKAAYDKAKADGADASVLDNLYQDLISSSYYLEQKFVALEPLPKPGEGGEGNQGGGGGSTAIPETTLDALYTAAAQMKVNAEDFEFNVYMEYEESGSYPYTEETMDAFYSAFETLVTLVDTYAEEAENESVHTMTKDDFVNAMLDLTVAQLSLVLIDIPETCNDR